MPQDAAGSWALSTHAADVDCPEPDLLEVFSHALPPIWLKLKLILHYKYLTGQSLEAACSLSSSFGVILGEHLIVARSQGIP